MSWSVLSNPGVIDTVELELQISRSEREEFEIACGERGREMADAVGDALRLWVALPTIEAFMRGAAHSQDAEKFIGGLRELLGDSAARHGCTALEECYSYLLDAEWAGNNGLGTDFRSGG